MHAAPTCRSAWLVRQPRAAPRVRLVCFSYAGGSAGNFATWQAGLDPAIEVCAVELPGRGTRFGEAPSTSFPQLVDAIADAICRQSPLPFAFFGHSLGALMAFEVARQLHQRGMAAPLHLWASGASAPRYRRETEAVHLLDDDGLIDELKRLNGTPQPVLANRDLMAMLLPMIRADFALAAHYTYRPGPLLNLPITVCMGHADENAGAVYVDGWGEETTGDFRIHWFDGDHFYLYPQRHALLATIGPALLAWQHAPCR